LVPTLLGELDAKRGSADPHTLNYNAEGSPVVHHVTGLDPQNHLSLLLERYGDAEDR
jgi:hypothetical protein